MVYAIPDRPEGNPWFRWYFITAGIIALGCARLEYLHLVHTPHSTSRHSFRACASVLDIASYACAVILLLVPWWRLGRIVSVLGYSIVMPVCIYIITSLLIVDIVAFHDQTLFHLMLLTALLSQAAWRFGEIQAKVPPMVKL